MPNLRQYSYGGIMANFDEAVRTIPGYDQYDPNKEVKALIDYDRTKNNYAIEINDCMILRGKQYEKKSRFIEELVTERLGKAPRRDATACSIVFTLPRDYLAGHDFGLTEEEYTAFQKSFEDNDGMPDDAHERALFLSAREKLTHVEWSDEEKEKIREYFEAAVPSLCKVCGIRREDVLYAVVHVDESMPHLHFAFLPMQYGREAYEEAKARAAAQGKDLATLKAIEADGVKIPIYRERNKAGQAVEKFSGLTCYEPGAGERPFGCGSKRFKKGFLHELNGLLEGEMRARGIATRIATGKGQSFRVGEHGRSVRQDQVLAVRTADLAEERVKAAEEKKRKAEELARIAEEKQREAEERERQAEMMEAQAQLSVMRCQHTLKSLKRRIRGLAEEVRRELTNMAMERLRDFFQKIRGAKKKELDELEKETNARAAEQATAIVSERFRLMNDVEKEAGKAEKKLKELSAQQKGFVAKQLAKLAGEEGGEALADLMQREDVLEMAYERYGDRENDYAYLMSMGIALESEEACECMTGKKRVERIFQSLLRDLEEKPETFSEETAEIYHAYKDREQKTEYEMEY